MRCQASSQPPLRRMCIRRHRPPARRAAPAWARERRSDLLIPSRGSHSIGARWQRPDCRDGVSTLKSAGASRMATMRGVARRRLASGRASSRSSCSTFTPPPVPTSSPTHGGFRPSGSLPQAPRELEFAAALQLWLSETQRKARGRVAQHTMLSGSAAGRICVSLVVDPRQPPASVKERSNASL